MAHDKENKVTKNISISPEAVTQGEALRAIERRSSYSNVVEWLINKEWEKRFGKHRVATDEHTPTKVA